MSGWNFLRTSDKLVGKLCELKLSELIRKGFGAWLSTHFDQKPFWEGGGAVSQDCLFCKIAAGEIPSDIVFENDRIVAFRDINPVAPVHILVIPKEHIASITHVKQEHQALMGEIVTSIQQIAEQENSTTDFGLWLTPAEMEDKPFPICISISLEAEGCSGRLIMPGLTYIDQPLDMDYNNRRYHAGTVFSFCEAQVAGIGRRDTGGRSESW